MHIVNNSLGPGGRAMTTVVLETPGLTLVAAIDISSAGRVEYVRRSDDHEWGYSHQLAPEALRIPGERDQARVRSQP